MAPEKNFAIREKPKGSVRINKVLFIIVAGLMLLAVIWILINAFSNSALTKSPAQDISNDTKPIASDLLNTLPQDYTDTSNVKKYLAPTAETSDVAKQIAALKDEQNLLRQQLATTQDKSVMQERDLQAKASGLFFPGSAPRIDLLNEQEVKAPDKQTKEKPDQPTASMQQSAYTKQNMQIEKLDFLQPSTQKEDIYDKHPLVKPISPYEIQAGSLIPAELITAINTTLPGSVVAQIRENVFDTISGKFLLIPKGSKLIGQYQSMVSYGQERVLIAFTRIIRPDGSSIQLDKYSGSDLWGQAGMQGNVNNHWGRVLGAATLSTLLSVGAGVAADHNYNHGDIYYRSAGQNALLGAADSIAQTGQQLTGRAMDIQPTLTLPSGYEFNVIVRKDMILEPYN